MFNFKMNMPFDLMVFYGSIMIAAVLVLHGMLKTRLPKFVFPVLWGVILLRLLVPFSVSSPLSMKVPGFAWNSPFETAYTENTAVSDIPVGVLYEGSASSTQNEARAETTAVIAQETAFRITYDDHMPVSPYTCVVSVYFIGLLATVSILLSQKYRYTKQLKNSHLIEHNETINTLLRESDMGHILVFTNDEIASPLVCGLRAPRIYLPTRMDFGNRELLRHILCHETMHIRRKDNWIKFVMLLALCVHWFNPLVWIMAKYLASDLEMACDEAVLHLYADDDETRKSYAFSLLAMAITGSRTALLYSAFSKTEVEKRIQSVLHYHKTSALLLTLSVCLVLSGSVVFATGGQAPFSPDLTSFCSSDSCRWGIRASLTRGASLGDNAEERAEKILFDIMRDDTTNDPDILKDRIINALSEEFRVEPGAFTLELSLCPDREELFAEYEKWGLVREEPENDSMLYNGESIRTYSDKMLGRYMSQQEGTVDLTVERNRLGEIIAVNVFRKGDAAYDRRTEELNQSWQKYTQITVGTTQAAEMTNDLVQEY